MIGKVRWAVSNRKSVAEVNHGPHLANHIHLSALSRRLMRCHNSRPPSDSDPRKALAYLLPTMDHAQTKKGDEGERVNIYVRTVPSWSWFSCTRYSEYCLSAHFFSVSFLYVSMRIK
ncbi:hypothetical protein AVEN_48295-1 [Araneus ventricosus]|uniref:Uncharacterized protein n=1 Tax=Araneus ventricosus TaxID=182803 RepID=A0A4Y2J9B1_ARAVE|nr:hypothetical protein AVEN_48295-1 [Araneus ventricosus]